MGRDDHFQIYAERQCKHIMATKAMNYLTWSAEDIAEMKLLLAQSAYDFAEHIYDHLTGDIVSSKFFHDAIAYIRDIEREP